MKLFSAARALGAGALSLALAAGVLSPAQARRSKVSDSQTYQLFAREQLSQGLTACASQFPRGVPLSVDGFPRERKATGLCFDHFADIYSGESKTPIVTVERLNRASIQEAQVEERTNAFFPRPATEGRRPRVAE